MDKRWTQEEMDQTTQKAKESNDQMTMSIGFGHMGVNIPGENVQESLRMLFDLLQQGHRPDGIVINNLTTGDSKYVRFAVTTKGNIMNRGDHDSA